MDGTTGVPSQPSGGPKAADVRASAKRFWPILAGLAFAAYFDWRTRSDRLVTVLLAGGVASIFLFTKALAPVLQPIKSITSQIPDRLRPVVIAGVPLFLLYFFRWRGNQGGLQAMLTMVATVGLGFLIASNRKRIDKKLTPFYRARDRVLPKPVRLVLVFLIPILTAFLIAHGNLGDIGALFGGETKVSRPSQGSPGYLIALSALISMVGVFLLLNEAPSEPEEGERV